MAVEIKELVIRASVSGDAGAQAAPFDPASPGEPRRRASQPRPVSPADVERIAAACVRRALKALNRSRER